MAVLLRSDSLANITSATNALFGSGSNQAGSLFTVTSIRQGFAGGGFYGEQGLPSKLALAAGIPGAASIPRQSPLFLGFTSTLVSNMGPDVIANLGDAAWPHRSVAQWVLQTGDDHASLAPVRRPGDLVREELPNI